MTQPDIPDNRPPETTEPAGNAATVPVDLASALNQMSGLLLSRETVQTALELVSALARTVTDGTLGAGVTVVDERGKRSLAATNDAVKQADALQYQLDEGPCLTAWQTQEMVRIDDTTTDGRWPRWNRAASALGVRSVLSAPLSVGGESIGAMKVYCERPLNYGVKDEQVMRLLADQAAILLANSQSLQQARRLSQQLTQALAGRDLIAVATGVLLARGAATRQDAFHTLADTARRTGRPVQDVARAVLAAVVAVAGNDDAAGT